MKNYYLGGYYLIRKKPIDLKNHIGQLTNTCSSCINQNLFDSRCISWVNEDWKESRLKDLQINQEIFSQIKKWTENKMKSNELKFGNSLPNMEMAFEYRTKFFNHLNDISIQSIYFEGDQASFLIDNQNDEFNNRGEFDIRLNLLNKISEKQIENEELLGFDLIGVECDGSFHTFFCHNILDELKSLHKLKINKNGLFEIDVDRNIDDLMKYLNSNDTGLAPIPYYIVKVKKASM